MSHNSKKVQHIAILAMAYQQQVVYYLSKSAIFNDLVRPLTQFQGHTIIWCWIAQKWYKIQT